MYFLDDSFFINPLKTKTEEKKVKSKGVMGDKCQKKAVEW
jgi:hypothetical protein